MKYHFNDKEAFAAYENKAIDGQLDYSEFPPAEYKYFSRLSKLGYLNRHSGWSVELCEMKQAEYLKDYEKETQKEKDINAYYKMLDARKVNCCELSRKLNFLSQKDEITETALELIENLLGEPGLKCRIMQKLLCIQEVRRKNNADL